MAPLETKERQPTMSKCLEIQDLAFHYQNTDNIFEGINFELHNGEILSLLGPNGCGKTTLLNCIIGLCKNTHGNIIINGKTELTGKEKSQALGFVPQTMTATFDYKVIDYVVCGVAPYLKMFNRPGKCEYERAWESLETMKITDLAEKSYAQISGGEQQLVSIARVLTQKPDFILLDEPTSHLDFGNIVRTLKIIKSMSDKGFGIIMTTHNPDHALMMGGSTLIMKDCGNFKFGNTKQIVTQDSLRDLYGIDLYLEESLNAQRLTCVAPKL
ncbi:MAG: ABC transporter ATP-binding protein [Coriobacteriia bacterium]|nr:ABC transporter ATP-binding protein [Coriobacteriia bacterium]